MSEAFDDWTYDPERDDPWLDEAVAELDRGEWVPHEVVVREIAEMLAEIDASEAARLKVVR